MKKATITIIGIVNKAERMASYWRVESPSDVPYYDEKTGRLWGYTFDELEMITHARDILANLDTVEVPITVTIPEGIYWPSAFLTPFNEPPHDGFEGQG